MATIRQANKSLYWAWKSMKQRCQNPKCKAFVNYGARGITVCAEWQEFEPFCSWALKSGFEPGLDLDRSDNNLGYSPENCRWVKRQENVNNRRKTIMLTVNGETKPRTEWERCLNLPSGIVKSWALTNGRSYAEQRIAEVLRAGYTERDFSRNHKSTTVRCIENGIIYGSYHDAAKRLNLNSGNILSSIRRKGTTGGYHFEIAEIG